MSRLKRNNFGVGNSYRKSIYNIYKIKHSTICRVNSDIKGLHIKLIKYYRGVFVEDYHKIVRFYSTDFHRAGRFIKGRKIGFDRVDLYEGSFNDKHFLTVFEKNLRDFLNKFPKGYVYGLMPKIILMGYDGSLVRSLGKLLFYCRDLGLEEFIIRLWIELVITYIYKYGLSDFIVVYVEYYRSQHDINTIRNHGALVCKGQEILPGDIIKRFYLHNKKVVDDIHIPLEYSALKPDRKSNGFNNNIMVIDLETYVDKDNMLVVYACGYKLMENGKFDMMVPRGLGFKYLSDYKDSDTMVKEFLREIINRAKNKTTIYAHNLGKFDGIFLFKKLMEIVSDKETIEPIVDNNVVKLVVYKTKGKTLRFHDSLLLLSAGLRTLCKAYEVETLKGYFPYRFVNKDTLNYVGKKPPQKDFGGISDHDYELIDKENWDLRKEALKYLEADINALMEVIIKFRALVIKLYQVDVAKHTTIPGLALKIYRKKYYKPEYDIRIIGGSVYKDIKRGFYGGKSEVYKPHGKNLYYYDINSLYPYAMLKPMPVGNPELIYYKEPRDGDVLDEIFGFAEAKIEAPKDIKRPLIPVRINNRIYNTKGSWQGMYFTEELKMARELGYKIQILYVYKFSRGIDIFKDYITTNYKMKQKSTGVMRGLYKLLLNSLFGKFGMLEYNYRQIIINPKERESYERRFKIVDIHPISDDKELIIIDPSVRSVLNDGEIEDDGLEKIKPVKNLQSLPIAAAITAYARMEMNKIIGDEKIEVYYTDTDSVVVNKELDESIVSGSKLGLYKLEHKVKKGIFILPKVYYMETEEGKKVMKFKGVKRGAEEGLYQGVIEENGERVVTMKDIRMFKDIWNKGGILEKEVELKFDLRMKTRRMAYRNGIWIRTIPWKYEDLMKEHKKLR